MLASVVDTVAGHRDDVTAVLQGLRDAQLLLRGNPADHDAVAIEEGTEQLIVVR